LSELRLLRVYALNHYRTRWLPGISGLAKTKPVPW